MGVVRGTTRTETVRNLLEKLSERRVHSEKVPNTVDLTPKLQKLPWPCALERRIAATRSCADDGVEPKHDGESPGEACAWGGGPKTIDLHSKMQKNQLATHTGTVAIHRIEVDG
jgi:hypothetical protein